MVLLSEETQRKTIRYFKIDDEFYVETYKNDKYKYYEMWMCRKNYGIKTFIVGSNRPITREDVLSELGLNEWDDGGESLGFFVGELLDEGEVVIVNNHYITKRC